MSGQVVNPAFFSQLGHNCVDPRETSLTLHFDVEMFKIYFAFWKLDFVLRWFSFAKFNSPSKYTHIGPLCNSLRVFVPRNLYTYRIALHFIEIRIFGCCTIEKLPPQKLTMQRKRWSGLFNFFVQIWNEKYDIAVCIENNPGTTHLLIGDKTIECSSNRIANMEKVPFG